MKKFTNNQQGQISIFFATTMFVVISFMAFIVNIGIFVKAKINLQNAVDAAAFSGASVQARQLTNIAYLNWEMRNVYKEWMFKYYILGNLNLNDVAQGASGTTDLTMKSYALGTNTAEDKYNFASICLDFARSGDVSVCTNFVISGLPRFSATLVGGLDETLNTFLDTIIEQKAKDCSNKSFVNFRTATLWAYNVDTSENNALQNAAPQIASQRAGAFPKAFELAIRMRNLEAQVNKEPLTGVCYSQNQLNQGFCSKEIENIIATDRSPSNERITKAFYSGFRNLGSEDDTEMRASFTLSEIPTTPFISDNIQSLSNLLIPANSKARNKHYLDLKLMTVNLSTFYTLFTQTEGNAAYNNTTVDTEGQCAATKTGLPVPGYPLGFVKNPDVLTYYAVKGQAKFIGLFNPFDIGNENGITLTAVAAAKPFGGRIGPRLFEIGDSNNTVLTPRSPSGTGKFISSAYISGIDLENLVDKDGKKADPSQYQPGAPLPLSINGKPFWQSDMSQAVGGWIDQGNIVFSIPNMIYDYPEDQSYADVQSYVADTELQLLRTLTPQSAKAGLYNAEMFNKLRSHLNGLGSNVTPTDIYNAIHKVRAPTRYDAYNYLIPTPEEFNLNKKVDSFGIVAGPPNEQIDGYNIYPFYIYAPLYSDYADALYRNYGDVLSVLQNYLEYQEVAVQKYIQSMNTAASQIYTSGENQSGYSGVNLATESVKLISDIPNNYLTGNPIDPNAKPTCASMAGRFAYFYLGANKAGNYMDVSTCDSTHPSLIAIMNDYLSNGADLGEYYKTTFSFPKDGDVQMALLSAYRPGDANDAQGKNGVFQNFLRKTTTNMWRNFYSTKFVALNSLLPDSKEPGASYTKGNFSSFSEANYTKISEISQNEIINWLDIKKINLELKNIKH